MPSKAACFVFAVGFLMLCTIGRSYVWRGRPSMLSLSMRAGGTAAVSHGKANVLSLNPTTTIDLGATAATLFSGDLLVFPFYQPADGKSKSPISLDTVPQAFHKIVADVLQDGAFKAEIGAKQLVRVYSNDASTKYVALVGLGPDPKKGKVGELDIKSAGRLGKALTALAKEAKATSVGVCLPPGTDNAGVTPLVLAIHDALYVDERFKKVPEEGFPPQTWKSLTLLGAPQSVVDNIQLTNKLCSMVASGVQFAKDLVGAPSCAKTPLAISDQVKLMAKEHKLDVKILGKDECEALGMGGYLGVQQGSKFPPRFVHLTYRPENPFPNVLKIALIGKGLTFDSGGYNLKTGAGSMIELMKFDMGGAAAVFGCAKAIAQLRPKNVEVHFISALCENMVSAEAVRPGDVLVASNQKTIEVINTDAEGRLTLADALVYAEKLQVDRIVDLATLTGASIVGLGEKVAALYSSDDDLLRELEQAARRSGESVWHMPLEAQYKESIKGTITDLKNLSGAKGGGSITAALFLQEFVEKTPWAHIDMAGPVWADSKPTGFGVKTLVDFLLNAKK